MRIRLLIDHATVAGRVHASGDVVDADPALADRLAGLGHAAPAGPDEAPADDPPADDGPDAPEAPADDPPADDGPDAPDAPADDPPADDGPDAPRPSPRPKRKR